MTKKNTVFRKITGKIHLWLGMVAGLVVFTSMSSAAIFIWEEELRNWYYADLVYVKPQQQRIKPISELLNQAQQVIPDEKIGDLGISHRPDKAYTFTSFQYNKAGKGWTFWANYDYWTTVYVNPYTGEVLGKVDMLTDWITLSRYLHQYLLLRHSIGHYIVGFATLFVMVLVVTGLVLWFPRNKAMLKQRLAIKWNARWRRVNYDVHNIGGFYLHLFILIFAITGLVWTFKWWTNGIYRLLGDDPALVFKKDKHEAPTFSLQSIKNPLDKIVLDLSKKRASWSELSLSLPDTVAKEGKEANYEVGAYLKFNQTAWDDWDAYYYHAQTGELVHQFLQEEKSTGEAWRNSNYAIHVGNIYGLPTKIIAFISALFLASLPITGFMIWYGRKYKKKTNTSKKTTQQKKSSRVT